MSRQEEITSVRQAAAVCNVTPPVVRRWLSLGLITEPPWTQQQLHQLRELTDPEGRRRGPQVAHGTLTRWLEGCDCDPCRLVMNAATKTRGRARAQKRLPVEVRQQLLDAIYDGRPFRTALHDLGLSSNRVWGWAKTDQEWSEKLDTALMAARRDDLQHGTNAAYMAGCAHPPNRCGRPSRAPPEQRRADTRASTRPERRRMVE